MFGVCRRGRGQRALPDDIEPHFAVGSLPGLIAFDAYSVAQLFGDVTGARVAGVQPQRHHIRPVRLRGPLGGVGCLRHPRQFAGYLSQ
ncbi:Uncharacterised protein [Mycobacterium tuberculosis]|nr:Uncharacterised protein [Mycobacterium tuberculosis]